VTDLLLAAGWLLVLALGGAFCAWLFRRGMPRTYVRDLLHVGAGVWVFGWPRWAGWVVPTLIPVLALVGLAAANGTRMPSALSRFQSAVSDSDERWSGLVLYAVSVAVLTPVGLLYAPFPAAAALLALALGDGLGGLVGRNLGRLRFTLPGAKPKSVEGAATVAVASAVAVWIADAFFGAQASVPTALLAGLAASLAEALAPRASDNLLVPAAVFGVLLALG